MYMIYLLKKLILLNVWNAEDFYVIIFSFTNFLKYFLLSKFISFFNFDLIWIIDLKYDEFRLSKIVLDEFFIWEIDG